jgi:myo-inositol-1-phosphate synthase
MKQRIRIAIAGVGNCASSLVQGIHYYAARREQLGDGDAAATVGLMNPVVGGFRAEDVEVVAAFDIDRRKVGRPLEEALLALPNNTKIFHPDLPRSGVTVQMGRTLDGVAAHMADYPPHQRFEPADERQHGPVDVAEVLRDSGAEILVS